MAPNKTMIDGVGSFPTTFLADYDYQIRAYVCTPDAPSPMYAYIYELGDILGVVVYISTQESPDDLTQAWRQLYDAWSCADLDQSEHGPFVLGEILVFGALYPSRTPADDVDASLSAEVKDPCRPEIPWTRICVTENKYGLLEADPIIKRHWKQVQLFATVAPRSEEEELDYWVARYSATSLPPFQKYLISCAKVSHQQAVLNRIRPGIRRDLVNVEDNLRDALQLHRNIKLGQHVDPEVLAVSQSSINVLLLDIGGLGDTISQLKDRKVTVQIARKQLESNQPKVLRILTPNKQTFFALHWEKVLSLEAQLDAEINYADVVLSRANGLYKMTTDHMVQVSQHRQQQQNNLNLLQTTLISVLGVSLTVISLSEMDIPKVNWPLVVVLGSFAFSLPLLLTRLHDRKRPLDYVAWMLPIAAMVWYWTASAYLVTCSALLVLSTMFLMSRHWRWFMDRIVKPVGKRKEAVWTSLNKPLFRRAVKSGAPLAPPTGNRNARQTLPASEVNLADSIPSVEQQPDTQHNART